MARDMKEDSSDLSSTFGRGVHGAAEVIFGSSAHPPEPALSVETIADNRITKRPSWSERFLIKN